MNWIDDGGVDTGKVTDYMGAFEDCIPRCKEMAMRIDTQGIGGAVKRYFIRKERL